MRGGSLRSWFALGVAIVLGACSNIIGISSYEIDPTLDDSGGSSAEGGTRATGGVSTSGSKGMGDAAGMGGDATAGSAVGGKNTGGTKGSGGNAGTAGKASMAGSDAAGGEGGAGGAGGVGGAGGTAGTGGSVVGGCTANKDCNDAIDCTTDTCLAGGKCGHAPKDNLCDASNCETCTVGIGCVGGPKTKTQVLLNPNFDDATNVDWDDSGSDALTNLYTVAMAQSGTKIAKFGPVAQNVNKHEYDDLLQVVSLPDGVVDLTVTGYYKLTPTTKVIPATEDDYVVLQLYDLADATTPVVEFHSFYGTDPAQATWKAFTYSATKAEIGALTASDFSFDFVGHVFSTYQFDTMTLTSTVCQ
jgi:hypothetical protein